MLLKITKILIDMSWFKNPWESANPWAEGKPEFKKAVGTAVDTDEQTAPAVVVDAIKYSSDFDAGMGLEMRKIIAETEYYKKYLTALNGTTEYDTYVFTWPSAELNTDKTKVITSFEKDGFTKSPGIVEGQTFLIEKESDFKLLIGAASEPSKAYKLQYVKTDDLKPSFDKKKKIILIGLARQFLQPRDYLSNKDPLVTNTWITDTWWDNVKLYFTHVLIHELIAHGIHHIKGDKKEPEIEHQNYHGVKGESSPNMRDVLADTTGKYNRTIMLKAIREIQSSIKKLYHNGK